MSNPRRSEVWLVDLGMMAKVRPVLVVSVSIEDQDRTLITVVPHTTAVHGTRFEVDVSSVGLKAGAFDCQNLISIPRIKFLKKLTVISAADLSRIEAAIITWLGLPLTS